MSTNVNENNNLSEIEEGELPQDNLKPSADIKKKRVIIKKKK